MFIYTSAFGNLLKDTLHKYEVTYLQDYSLKFICKAWKQFKCPSIRDWFKKTMLHSPENYETVKRNCDRL